MAGTPIELEVKAIVDAAINDLKRVSGSIENIDDSSKKATGGTNKLASGLLQLAGTVGIAASIGGFVTSMKNLADVSIQTAARAQELKAKFDVTFGQAAPKARQELENFGDTVHRSNLDLQEMSANIQAVLSAMGMNKSEAAELSVELTKLAVDMGAFNNASDTDVLVALRAAISGEYESMKRYGVVLNEATVAQELLNMGIEGGTKAATAAEKAQARFNVIMTATKDAQGAAAREADSYTNISKGLESALTDLHAALGQRLIPAMTEFKKATTGVVEAITENIERTNLLTEAQEMGIISMQDYVLETRFHRDVLEMTDEELAQLIETEKQQEEQTARNTEAVSALSDAHTNYGAALDEVATAQADLEKAQQSWLESTANEVVSALGSMKVEGDSYKDALLAIDEVFGTNETAEAEHKQRIEDIVAAYSKTGDIEDFRTALAGLKDDELPKTTEQLEAARSKAEEFRLEIQELRDLAEEPLRFQFQFELTGDTDIMRFNTP